MALTTVLLLNALVRLRLNEVEAVEELLADAPKAPLFFASPVSFLVEVFVLVFVLLLSIVLVTSTVFERVLVLWLSDVFVLLSVFVEAVDLSFAAALLVPLDVVVSVPAANADGERPKAIARAAAVIVIFFIAPSLRLKRITAETY